MTPDYDCFGHCVLCHKNMTIEKVIDGKIKTVLSPDYTTANFLLNDKSNMKVAMCKQCKANLTDDDVPKIMESVKRGWQKETERIEHWSDEKKQQYIEEYNQKEIIMQNDGIRL